MIEKSPVKTNAVRILEDMAIKVTTFCYNCSDGQIDGVSVAKKISRSTDEVFKTLVTIGANQELFVFLIPVTAELDLKLAALAVNNKRIEMLPLKDINKFTGYIRGGCSPVGMKKLFPTVIEEEAMLQDKIIVSAGKLGVQMELAPSDLKMAIGAVYARIIKG